MAGQHELWAGPGAPSFADLRDWIQSNIFAVCGQCVTQMVSSTAETLLPGSALPAAQHQRFRSGSLSAPRRALGHCLGANLALRLEIRELSVRAEPGRRSW
jgi:hypothetical protein